MLNLIFVETTGVVDYVSTKSYYNYKTDLGIWKEDKEFEHQKNSRSQPPFDSTSVGMKMSDRKISPLDLTTIGSKTSDPKTPIADSSKYK